MKVIAWIIGLPIAIIVVWGIGRLLFCGPDKSIQQVTDPLATAILDHINAYGRPESLADIPNLPYEMKNCRQLKVREKRIYREQCSFVDINKKKYFFIDTESYTNRNSGKLTVVGLDIKNNDSNTKINYDFRPLKNGKLQTDDVHIDTIQDSFLCKNGILKIA